MTETKVSTGAQRAARKLEEGAPCHDDLCPHRAKHRAEWEANTAAMIERETHAGEMERLLQIMTQRPIASRLLIQAGNEARELLQRIERGE